MTCRRAVPYTAEEKTEITTDLGKSLGPEWLSQRTGGGNHCGRLTYIEGRTAINLANQIFGFNGWCTEVKSQTVDFVDINDQGRVSVGISAIVRVTLRDGTFHEDVGYGSAENSRNKVAAFEKAKKEATTDAMKRALRMFGNALGNCLYDKNYIANISKTAKQEIKFYPQDLYRHPQFAPDNSPPVPSPQHKPTVATPPAAKPPSSTATTTATPQIARAEHNPPANEVEDEVFAYLIEQESDKPDVEILEGLAEEADEW
ncbi:DNA repair protein rad52 [Apophysomyces ossiformis]|uniref:DNA repair protein rad52 n=1 Tax=Apophysomyces ossiformis TaxID=679940 RepID=A0A8H7BXP9_9FUNG|nr:DNA repair protein rad52 [Apophysomyces ossiformis]